MSTKGITVNLCGGLGNQMFIIATMLSISKKQGIPYFLPKLTHSPSITPRGVYWDNIFYKLQLVDSSPLDTSSVIKEKNSNEVVEIPEIMDGIAMLDGYFQSSKYFDRDTVSIFDLPDDRKNIVNNLWDSLTKGDRVNFIHVRRGDYLHLQHFHFVLTQEWYTRALSHFDDNDLFLIFSDDPEWCKENLNFLKNKKFVQDIDYQELFLMSKCDGGIISNSTFSWWGAYLGKEHKKIVCPDIWYLDRFSQKMMRNELGWIEEIVNI